MLGIVNFTFADHAGDQRVFPLGIARLTRENIAQKLLEIALLETAISHVTDGLQVAKQVVAEVVVSHLDKSPNPDADVSRTWDISFTDKVTGESYEASLPTAKVSPYLLESPDQPFADLSAEAWRQFVMVFEGLVVSPEGNPVQVQAIRLG